jgi:hypothetical protein
MQNKKCTEVPHAQNLGAIAFLAFSTKCIKGDAQILARAVLAGRLWIGYRSAAAETTIKQHSLPHALSESMRQKRRNV